MADVTLTPKYQIGAFFTGATLETGPKATLKLMQTLLDAGHEAAPSIVQELNPATGEVRARARFASSATGIAVDFGGDRIDVYQVALATKRTIGPVSQFSEVAMSYMRALFPLAGAPASRFTMITESIASEITNVQLKAAFDGIFVPNILGVADVQEDWLARFNKKVVLQIGGRDEECNDILTIGRVRGQLGDFQNGVDSFQGIQLSTDMNTSADNTDRRFDIESLAEFVRHAQAAVMVKIANHIEIL